MGMRLQVYGVIGVFLLALGSWPGAAAAAPPPLSVVGNHLVDPRGKLVTLRGVSVLAPEHNAECQGCKPKPTAEMIGMAADASQGWHARVVRIPITRAAVKDTRLNLKTVIEPAVAAATRANLYVIIDLHLVDDYGPGGKVSQASLIEFWRPVARRYRDEPHVMFEVFNEPIKPDNWETFRTFIQPVVDAIREEAPQNIILVGSPNWSTRVNEAARQPLKGRNLVYVYHLYPNQGPASAANLESRFGAAAKSIPIMLTEFGWNPREPYADDVTRGTTQEWGEPLRAYLDQRPNISWVSWIFDNFWKPMYFDENWKLMGQDSQGEFMKRWLSELKDDHQPRR